MLSHKKRATDESRTRDLFLTKEALYHWATAAFCTLSFRVPCFSKRGFGFSSSLRSVLERKTGLEPATYSLEGYRSTKWATSACWSLAFVGEGGLEPPNSSEDRFTVCCNCRYATPPISNELFWFCWCSSRWRDSNPRQADYKSATLPTELHRLCSNLSNNSLFSVWGCKDTTFFKYRQSFFHFFCTLYLNSLKIKPC